MAKTEGHGNPNWTWDETVLALELYQRLGGVVPGPRDERVLALSAELRSLPYHATAARKPTFRNADGVAFKLQNLRQVAIGRGLSNVSQLDRRIWAELGSNPSEARRLGGLIRAALGDAGKSTEPPDLVFAEGRLVTEWHRRRERSPKLRQHLLAARRPSGLRCDICDIAPTGLREDLREVIFEGHHVVPLAEAVGHETRLSDMALLCANCHRLIHGLIAQEGRWVGIAEARSIIGAIAVRDVA